MINPILNQIRQPDRMDSIKAILNGDTNAIYQQMLRNNPQFAQFAQSVQGKTPEQVCREYGIDPAILNGMLR